MINQLIEEEYIYYVECKACGKRIAGRNRYELAENMKAHIAEHYYMQNLPSSIIDEIKMSMGEI